MVNAGKREDGLLDFVNEINGKLKMVKTQIELYREGSLTANEIKILNTISALIEDRELIK